MGTQVLHNFGDDSQARVGEEKNSNEHEGEGCPARSPNNIISEGT